MSQTCTAVCAAGAAVLVLVCLEEVAAALSRHCLGSQHWMQKHCMPMESPVPCWPGAVEQTWYQEVCWQQLQAE